MILELIMVTYVDIWSCMTTSGYICIELNMLITVTWGNIWYMNSYGSTQEGTICDHVWPGRLIAAAQGKGPCAHKKPYATMWPYKRSSDIK